MTGVKFGISFTTRFLNQANALVNLYTDGTVQVSTGGTEMGQGLQTKVQQLVADEFSIPHVDVNVMPTSTEKNNNTSPTAASAGTDLNGAAAVAACRKLKRRLRQFAAGEFASELDGLARSPRDVRFQQGFVTDRRDPKLNISILFCEPKYSKTRSHGSFSISSPHETVPIIFPCLLYTGESRNTRTFKSVP